MKQRQVMMIATILVVGGALLALVVGSFSDSLVYFLTPTELQARAQQMAGQKVRLGGMVKQGSLVKEPGTLKMRFLVTDGEGELPVVFEGVAPDLFREGQGVIAEGVWQPGQAFMAGTLLAKHSEDYMPVEMSQEGIDKSRESLLKSLR